MNNFPNLKYDLKIINGKIEPTNFKIDIDDYLYDSRLPFLNIEEIMQNRISPYLTTNQKLNELIPFFIFFSEISKLKNNSECLKRILKKKKLVEIEENEEYGESESFTIFKKSGVKLMSHNKYEDNIYFLVLKESLNEIKQIELVKSPLNYIKNELKEKILKEIYEIEKENKYKYNIEDEENNKELEYTKKIISKIKKRMNGKNDEINID